MTMSLRVQILVLTMSTFAIVPSMAKLGLDCNSTLTVIGGRCFLSVGWCNLP